MGIIAIAVVAWGMPWFRTPRGERIDYLGGALLILATTSLLLALSWGGNQYAWTDPHVLAPLILAAAALLAFVRVEWGRPNAVLPLHLFRNRAFLVPMLVLATVGVGMFGSAQFIPLFAQGVHGSSATSAGTVMMPMMGGVVAGATLAGQLISRSGRYRLLAVVGSATAALGAFLLSTLTAESSQWTIRGYMVVMGLGIGTSLPVYTLMVQNALPYRVLGVGSASTHFFRQVGGAMGVAVFGSLLVTKFAGTLGDATGAALERLKERPQALLDPAEVAAFRASVEADAPGTADAAIETARVALAGAITDLFLIAGVILALAIPIALFLPAVRARTRDDIMQEIAAARAEPPLPPTDERPAASGDRP